MECVAYQWSFAVKIFSWKVDIRVGGMILYERDVQNIGTIGVWIIPKIMERRKLA